MDAIPAGTPVSVLDGGYVTLLETFGDDLKIVNAAKASYARRSDKLGRREIGILEFLAFNDHESPIRHTALSFEAKAPLMVARQWHTYAVASVHSEEQQAWNESSRRYVTDEPQFHVPNNWREAPANKKQGSGEFLDQRTSDALSGKLFKHQMEGLALYQEAQKLGACVEQSRLFLAAYGMYINWQWTCSLQTAIHFLIQRLDEHAQWEIREHAAVVEKMVYGAFPQTLGFFYEAGMIGLEAKQETYNLRHSKA